MKVSIAVIKLVLRTNKTLADGSHPIMLRVSFNGMKERSTGYSCLEKYWSKKSEMVKKGYPNFVMVNAELKRMKDEAIAKRNVMNEDNIPLIDLECRYYSYRHSYIMKEIQKPTVNLLALAQTVGKSATTLHQYISLLGDVDLV